MAAVMHKIKVSLSHHWFSSRHHPAKEIRRSKSASIDSRGSPLRAAFGQHHRLRPLPPMAADFQGAFFFLLQSEDGDLFKLTIDHEGENVRNIKIKYFDTVPVSTSLCILKSGYLFAASEFGDQYVHRLLHKYFNIESRLTSRNLYQFQNLGDDDDEQEFTSSDYPENGNENPLAPLPYAFFSPRPLQNLLLVDTLTSLDPITDAQVVNLLGATSDTPQIYAACGRGARSTFRTLKQGLEVSPVVASPLPGVPTAVWTLKLADDGELTRLVPSLRDPVAHGQMSTTHTLSSHSLTVHSSSRSARLSKKSTIPDSSRPLPR